MCEGFLLAFLLADDKTFIIVKTDKKETFCFNYPLSNKMTDRYDDSHRLFVQSMLSKRIISEADAEKLYDKISALTESKW